MIKKTVNGVQWSKIQLLESLVPGKEGSGLQGSLGTQPWIGSERKASQAEDGEALGQSLNRCERLTSDKVW